MLQNVLSLSLENPVHAELLALQNKSTLLPRLLTDEDMMTTSAEEVPHIVVT